MEYVPYVLESAWFAPSPLIRLKILINSNDIVMKYCCDTPFMLLISHKHTVMQIEIGTNALKLEK